MQAVARCNAALVCLLVALAAAPLACGAADPPNPQHTQEVLKDREELLKLFRSTPRIKEQDFPDAQQFVDEQRGTVYLVTKENHPAHPAMVTQQMAEENGKLVIKLSYERGGDEAAFRRWINDLAASNKKLTDEANNRPAAPDRRAGDIEYRTVPEALAALKAKPGVQVREQDGWTDVVDKTGPATALWNFVPANDPAYPAVIKRTVLDQNGELYIDMRVLCGAPKSACDKLTRDFQALNEKMKAEMNARR